MIAIAAAFMVADEVAARGTYIDIALDGKEPNLVEMEPGYICTIRIDGNFEDLQIGNSSVVDVVPLTTTSFSLLTKGAGRTNIVLIDENKELLGSIDVVVRRSYPEMTELRELINGLIPGADISTALVNDRIFVTGEVGDHEDAKLISRIADKYRGGGKPVFYSVRYRGAVPSEVSVTRGGERTNYNVPPVQIRSATNYGIYEFKKPEPQKVVITATPAEE